MKATFVLELAEVAAAIAAGKAEADGNQWPVTIAVVDAAGIPIQVTRLDGASLASVNVAIEKARSSALVGVPTKMIEAMVSERPALLSMDRVAVEGGVPILFQGQKLGGIGVSGVQSHQDSQVAEAALAAIDALLAQSA